MQGKKKEGYDVHLWWLASSLLKPLRTAVRFWGQTTYSRDWAVYPQNRIAVPNTATGLPGRCISSTYLVPGTRYQVALFVACLARTRDVHLNKQTNSTLKLALTGLHWTPLFPSDVSRASARPHAPRPRDARPIQTIVLSYYCASWRKTNRDVRKKR